MKVGIDELGKLLDQYYQKKKALIITGTFGIGKSAVIRDKAKEIAIKKNKAFREWNKLSKKERREVIGNPERYFVLIDIRLAEWDSSDIKGLPDFNEGGDSIKWKIPDWAEFITLEGSDGFVFFDELNLGSPLVISSVYKILYDREISDRAINDNWLVLGAGNLDSDRAFTHTLPAPVKDRGGEVELMPPNDDEWVDWAINNKIDSKIIGFIKFSPDNLHNIDFDSNQKFTTHRGWERVSNLIDGITNNYDLLTLVTCSAIGEGIGRKFVAFCKIEESMNLEDVIKNPQKLKEIKDIDVRYFLVTSVAERTRSDNERKIPFSKIMEISKVLDEDKKAEFVALLWKMSSAYSDTFKEDFMKCTDKTIEKYSKYIL